MSLLIPGIFLFESTKERIKFFSVKTYERVKSWSQHKSQDFIAILDEKLLLNAELVGFTNKLVYTKGEKIYLHLSGKSELLVTVFQVNKSGNKVIHSTKKHVIENTPIPVLSTFDGIISPTTKVELETSDLKPGWIGILITDNHGNEVEIPAFLDEAVRLDGIVFVESTDTLLAYNPAFSAFSIPNFYRSNLDISASHLIAQNTPIVYHQIEFSDSKNIDCNDHLINSDAIHKRNLTYTGIDFKTVSDEKLDDPNEFSNIEILIFGTHNEYWTAEKAINVMNFIDAGGKVLFLGGNTAWRKVFREQNRTWFHGSGLSDDPIFSRLINNYLGSYYDATDYATHAPFDIVNHELISDRFKLNFSGTSVLGDGTAFKHCEAQVHGVSGHETDKMIEGSAGFTVLAKGSNNNGGADLLYKKFDSGGEVLNFGSLAVWHNKDPNLLLLIKSFINQSYEKNP